MDLPLMPRCVTARVYLFTAVLFGVGRAVGLKTAQGSTRHRSIVLFITAMAVSLGLLTLAARADPVGIPPTRDST
jgi:multidrug transporter EmrE-like cation transporter